MVCIYSLSLWLSEIALFRICNYQITGTEVIYAANADDKNERVAGTLWLALGSISIIFGSISTASSILFLTWNRAKGLKWATMAFAFAAGALAFGAWGSAFYGDNKCATSEVTNMFPSIIFVRICSHCFIYDNHQIQRLDSHCKQLLHQHSSFCLELFSSCLSMQRIISLAGKGRKI